MARSEYVYTVQDQFGLVHACFTVKRELATWLKDNDVRPFGPPVVMRHRDGGWRSPIKLDPATLKEIV